MNGAQVGDFSLLLKCIIIVVKIANLVSTLANTTGDKSHQSSNRTLLSAKMKVFIKVRFPKVRTGRPYHGRTSHFDTK